MCNLSEAVVENTINKEIERMLKDGKSAEDIHDFCGYSLETILKIQSEINENN